VCNAIVECRPREVKPRNSVRAAPLEQAVLLVLKRAFSGATNIRERLSEIAARVIENLPSEIEKERMGKELSEIKQRVSDLQRSFTKQELEENLKYLSELRNRRVSLERSLATANTEVKADPDKLASTVLQSLNSFENQLSGEGYEKLRLLVNNVTCSFLEAVGFGRGSMLESLPNGDFSLPLRANSLISSN
jgi:chromosome segregation ATPase